MGKVISKLKEVNRNNFIDILSSEFKVNDEFLEVINEGNKVIYKNIELDSVLVNAIWEEGAYLEKLVSLKAFLLSKEQGMDINMLLFNINRVMKISKELNVFKGSIKLDNNLRSFLEGAKINIDIENGILNDSKRSVNVNIIDDRVDFNSIKEIR